jgi:hypothetical protein
MYWLLLCNGIVIISVSGLIRISLHDITLKLPLSAARSPDAVFDDDISAACVKSCQRNSYFQPYWFIINKTIRLTHKIVFKFNMGGFK